MHIISIWSESQITNQYFMYSKRTERDVVILLVEKDPHRGSWRLCVYCLESYDTSAKLCQHLRKRHGVCSMQCRMCFYRTCTINSLLYHYVSYLLTATSLAEYEYFLVLCKPAGTTRLYAFLPANVNKVNCCINLITQGFF